MKIVVNIFLILWFSFLSAPTVVSLVTDDADYSISYNMSEEESETKQKNFEEGHNEFLLSFNPQFTSLILNSLKERIHSNNNIIITVFEETFSPPPEMV